MYKNMIYPQNQNQNTNSMSYIRVLHAVPDAPNVDIYANDRLIAENLSYGNNTEYLRIPEGNYEITLYVAGSKNAPILDNMLTVNRNTIVTVAAVGTLSEIEFMAIADANVPNIPGEAMIRFSHLSPDAPAVDITLPDGTVIFDDVSFKQITPYVDVSPMIETLQVRLAGTSTVVLTVPNINLASEEYYTIYAIGLVGGNPGLEALLLLDGI